MCLMGSEEVLEAHMAFSGSIGSTSSKIERFRSRSSNTASMIRSVFSKPSYFPVAVTRLDVRSRSYLLIMCFLCFCCRFCHMLFSCQGLLCILILQQYTAITLACADL